MQTKKQSFIEAVSNTAIGFAISLVASFIIFPIVGIASSGKQNVVVVVFFTAISIIRGYVVRRYFNKKL